MLKVIEMGNYRFLKILLFLFTLNFSVTGQPGQKDVILDKPGFPLVFELDTGESLIITRSHDARKIKKEIKLISLHAFTEPNCWFSDTPVPFNYYQFEVNMEIDGNPVTIFHRPYQMPVTFEGLRIYIENIRQLDESAWYGKCGDMKKQVRIAVCMENEPWGPDDTVFPVNDYVWRSAVYNNTWSSLVPFNLLYYHRGEDYGAIPDRLDVVSPVDGIIAQTPLPNGDGKSNAICIESKNGMRWRLSHMNIESVKRDYPVGTFVRKGTMLAKTGMTWNGKRTQKSDPHLHTDLVIDGKKMASFPYLMEAYLKKYPDKVIAIAGGYRFTKPGNPVDLDGGRSFSGGEIPLKSYIWKLSNGETVYGQKAKISYDQPGFYTEELIVENETGDQDRDFLYVRVSDRTRGRNIAYGWAYYYPLRGIKTGMEVLFWNRLINVVSDTMINFGDHEEWYPIIKESTHRYKSPGKYIVTLRSAGPENEHVELKMELTVEN